MMTRQGRINTAALFGIFSVIAMFFTATQNPKGRHPNYYNKRHRYYCPYCLAFAEEDPGYCPRCIRGNLRQTA